MGRFTFQILSAVAEFERELIVERTKAGIEKARRNGKRIGRPPIDILKVEMINSYRTEGLTYREIFDKPGVSLGQINRVLNG